MASGRLSFLDLPLELRENVYSFAFTLTTAINCAELRRTNRRRYSAEFQEHVAPPRNPPAIPLRLPVALFRTCHQLHSEAAPFLYKKQPLRIHTGSTCFWSGPFYWLADIAFTKQPVDSAKYVIASAKTVRYAAWVTAIEITSGALHDTPPFIYGFLEDLCQLKRFSRFCCYHLRNVKDVKTVIEVNIERPEFDERYKREMGIFRTSVKRRSKVCTAPGRQHRRLRRL